jgi:hypothetical protein
MVSTPLAIHLIWRITFLTDGKENTSGSTYKAGTVIRFANGSRCLAQTDQAQARMAY